MKECLWLLAGKYRRMLCQIHPEKMAVQSSTELNVIEKLPYPSDPSICLNNGIDTAVIITGIITLTK